MNIPKLIERAGERVLTTAQLAEAYGTTAKEIAYNFNGNKKYYTEGKHFYCLTGDALRKFKRDSGNSGIAIPKNVNRYYLWTECGALLHAKSLNTDTAWAVYDFLVENYFRKKEQQQTPKQCEQKQTAALLSELRRKQVTLATAEAELAVQKARVACERRTIADFIMLHPELMPYANLLTVND